MKDYTPPFFSFPKGYGREVYQTRVFVWDEREFIQRLAEGNGIVNCYMTVYPIPAPRDYEGARVDRIWFDFDRKYTASPYLDTRRLSDWCARVGLLHSVISSGRGYHTHIYSETLTHDQRSTLAFVQRNILGVVKACPVCLSDDVVAFPQEFKHQCNKCGFTDSTSRFSIHPDPHFLHGNLSVMCRAPFTLNMNAGCIAYPIPRSELLKGEASVDEYRRRTK